MAHANLTLVLPRLFPQVLSRALHFEVNRLSPRVLCTTLDREGYPCGDPAVLQYLPDGDEADCAKCLRRRQLKEALRSLEVSRG